MGMNMKTIALVLALVLLAASGASAAMLQPLVVGWENYFKLDWQPDTRAGRPVVSGHILNDWGFPARNVRLLVEGLDSSGGVTSQRIAWLGSMLTPGMRAYFEVPVPGAAPSYRVSVFSFDWVQTGGGDMR